MKRMLLPAVLVVLASVDCQAKPPAADGKKEEAAAAPTEKEPFGRMTVDELDARLKDPKSRGTLFVFDNNGKDRFERSHVPTAKWVAFNDIKASDLPPQKDATLVFYCANEH